MNGIVEKGKELEKVKKENKEMREELKSTKFRLQNVEAKK